MAFYPDISHWKPVKDWAQVKKNCPFIISKATQGTTYIDPTLDSFIKGCETNGIPYWLYTFLNKGNEKAQAEYMVKVCKPKVGKYFRGYILDIESGNTANGVKSALDYLKKQSEKTMIYTMYAQYEIYKDVIEDHGVNCAWWEARYGKNNGQYDSNYPCHKGVDLHQYTSAGSCAGIGSTVDLSRLTGTKGLAWFTGETAPKKAVKAPKKATKKSADTIAKEVMAGKWGNEPERAKKLKAAGYTAAEIKTIQSKVNALVKATKKKSIETIAKEIVAGKWGNGLARTEKLAKAGYTLAERRKIQAAVNKLLKG